MEQTIKLIEGGVISTEHLTKEELEKLNREQLTELCIWILRANRRLKNKNEELKKKIWWYIEELQMMSRKAERRKKDTTYQRQTLTLYKKVLAKIVWCEGDF